MIKYVLLSLFVVGLACSRERSDIRFKKTLEQVPKNIIFILSDDHRYDFMGFMNKTDFLETPSMDLMAEQGIHCKNTFVTTSLCSPSRASILTGQFSHHHGVVDNQSLISDSTIFFPQYLQESGYQTAFIGKWHMGEHHANKRKGFDHWVSFKGQGNYYKPTLNINGEEKKFNDSTYVTDLLTDYALDFIRNVDEAEPFFMYLSHKGVHAEFKPARRHENVYKDATYEYPPTFHPPEDANASEYNYKDLPDWVKKQRHSWHGVDYMYHGQIPFDQFYKKYAETLLSVDESIGSVIELLKKKDLLKNTIVMYMGDNGFSFGEHGLIDKRQAYEESMRVPLLIYGAEIEKGEIEKMIQNIDIAPTILELAGISNWENMDGKSFVPLIERREVEWRDKIFYEYYWERAFPQTPTMHAVRTDRFKYIRYYGIWDINELYDLKEDPNEMNNLIRNPDYADIARELNEEIFKWLKESNGLFIPLRPDQGKRFDHKYRGTY